MTAPARPPSVLPSSLGEGIAWGVILCHLAGDGWAWTRFLAHDPTSGDILVTMIGLFLLRLPAVLLVMRLAQRARRRHSSRPE